MGNLLSFTQVCALQLSPPNTMLCQRQHEVEAFPPPHPLLSPQVGGWPLGHCSFKLWESLIMLSKPLLPKSQLVTCEWEALQGRGGDLSAVTLEMGSPPIRLISTIWENMVSVFSFVTAIRVVNLYYRPEWSDNAVKGLFLRGSVEWARCHTSSCSFHSSSNWNFTPC